MANKPGAANFFPDVPKFPSMGTFQPVYGKFDLTTYIQGASDYEIMAFLVGKYNACLEAYGNITKLSTDTITACKQLQDWINSWFTDLDVQDELNNKIDSMVADGSFGALLHQTFDTQINQQTASAVTEWLVANVTPTGSAVVVDKSLSIEGAAADAKVVGLKAILGTNRLYYDTYSAGDNADFNNVPFNTVAQYANVEVTHAPFSPFNGVLMTYSYSSNANTGLQVAISSDGLIYNRTKQSTGWSGWFSIDDASKLAVKGTGALYYDTYTAGDNADFNNVPFNTVAQYANVEVTNAPFSPFNGVLMTYSYSSNANSGLQVAISSDGLIYNRTKQNSSWSGWFSIDDGRKKVYRVGYGLEYTTLTSALIEAEKEPNVYKRIEIYGGTYDIFEEMGGSEYFNSIDPAGKNSSDFNHWVTNIDIVGYGEVNIVMDMSTVTNPDTRWLFSPINVKGNFHLENLNVVATNCRYAIHDESGTDFSHSTHSYKNIRATTNVNQAVGCGYSSANIVLIDNCTFSAPHECYSYHSKGRNKLYANNSCFIISDNTRACVRLSQELNGQGNDAIFNSCAFIGGKYQILLRREYEYSPDTNIYTNVTNVTCINSNVTNVRSEYTNNNATCVTLNTLTGTRTVLISKS